MARHDQPPHPRPRPHRRNQVRLRLGREPVVLPEPLAALVRELVASRHGHASLGDQGTSPLAVPRRTARPAHQRRRTSPNDCANSGSGPDKTDRPRCSAWPPNSPPPCSPDCSASTSASPSPGNAPAAETGPTTPPTTAVAHRPQPDLRPSPRPGMTGIRTVRISDSTRGRLPRGSHQWAPRVHRPPAGLRPGKEYRRPDRAGIGRILGHFQHRKVALGTCGRSYATPCIHEHAR